MPTYRECGAILAVMLLAGTLGLCSLLDGTSGLTTGGRSKVTFRTNVEQTGLLELTANEEEARIHTLRDQQKFLLKHADVGPINQMVDSMPELVHLLDSGKTPEMLGNNCMLNKLSDAYGDCKATYREGQGDTFVDGPVSDFTTNYANAKTGLDDEKYMEVASSKSRLDLMLLYMKTCHTVDVCMYKEDEQNAKTVAENPVLFMPSEAQCSKVTQVKAEFETGAGAALLQERDRECAAVCPALAFDVEGGTVAVSNNGTYPSTATYACEGGSPQSRAYLNTHSYVGCFADKTDDRDLPVSTAALEGGDRQDSLIACADQCAGYKYMGLQWEGECFCGNSYGSHGSAECPDDCGVGGSTGCSGRNAIYGGTFFLPPTAPFGPPSLDCASSVCDPKTNNPRPTDTIWPCLSRF